MYSQLIWKNCEYNFVEKEIPEVRFVRITRDPQGYEFPPAKLALRSACEFAMDYETVSKSRNRSEERV